MSTTYFTTSNIQQFITPIIEKRDINQSISGSTGTATWLNCADQFSNFPYKDSTSPSSDPQNFDEPTSFSFFITPNVTPFFVKRFSRIRLYQDIFLNARRSIEEIENDSVKQKCDQIIKIIQNQLNCINDQFNLRPIHVTKTDNGSVFIEWMFTHFRLGFDIQVNENESNYFLVSDRIAGEVQSSGYLQGLNLDALIASLIILALYNND